MQVSQPCQNCPARLYMQPGRRRGGQQKQWHDNVKEWIGMPYAETQAVARDRAEWQAVVK